MYGILLAAAVSALTPSKTDGDPQTMATLTAVANYVVLSQACFKLTKIEAYSNAREEVARVLSSVGFSYAARQGAVDRFVDAALDEYVAAINSGAEGSERAVEFFCSQAVPEKLRVVEKISKSILSNR